MESALSRLVCCHPMGEPTLSIPRIITEDYDCGPNSAPVIMPVTGRSHSLQTPDDTLDIVGKQRMRSLSGPSHPISLSPNVR
ncbi:unnamed protein product, partial [Medioppia subpectinata]